MISFVLLAAAAGLSLVYLARYAGRPEGQESWGASLTKTAATALLPLAALTDPDFAHSPPMALVLAGLALGALGDFALSRPGTRAFLAGMAAFAAGHLAYVAAFSLQAAEDGFAGPTQGQILALFALAAVVLPLGLWLSARAGALRPAVIGYALVIGLMAGFALMLPPGPGVAVQQAGVALFLLSDTLLALRLFRTSDPRRRKVLALAVWPSYWIGQALILLGTGLHFLPF